MTDADSTSSPQEDTSGQPVAGLPAEVSAQAGSQEPVATTASASSYGEPMAADAPSSGEPLEAQNNPGSDVTPLPVNVENSRVGMETGPSQKSSRMPSTLINDVNY
ncbi:MAG: hypothetical protein Q7S05_01005, partial [bacterium]|nr:hypothetical protein [bacterium]